MHYLVSFTWLFDLRYWRLLPLVCRRCSEESPRRTAPFGERAGMDGVFLAHTIWTHFWKIKSHQQLESLGYPSSVTARNPFHLQRALLHAELRKNLKKLREGLILLDSLARFVFAKTMLFLPFTLQHCQKIWIPGERNCPLRSPGVCMRFVHIRVNTVDAAESRLPRACLGFSPGKVSSLLIREAVVTGGWYLREKRSFLLAVKARAQK